MKKIIGLVLFGLLIAGAVIGYSIYNAIYQANTKVSEDTELFVYTGTSFEDVCANLEANYLNDIESFSRVANLKKFQKVKPGRYVVSQNMSNNALINMLRGGLQQPVKVTFNNARSNEEVSGKLAKYLELDSVDILNGLEDKQLAKKFGFNSETFRTMFIPDTYEMYWNTNRKELFERMAKEYKRFWNEDRLAKANKIGLSQSEVSTLASIVKAETAKIDEAPRVAGVYLNRLKRGIALQADPTLIYALGDFSIRRVLDKHKEIDSPYNTYKYAGLPPGPINFPSGRYVDAVLNPESHQYLYFCAKEDFSGYHNFAKSYNQHLVNARKYQSALNKMNVYR